MSLFNYQCDETKRIIDEVSPNYPQLTTFEKEWIFFHKYHYAPGVPVELECQEVIVKPTGTVQNAIPFSYKSVILKGNTDENLQTVKMAVLKTTGKNLFDGEWEQGGINQSTGELITSNGYRCKNKIPVVPLSQLVSNANLNLLFYDENDLFVGYKFQTQEMTMQVPKGAVYLRFYRSAKIDGLQVEANTVISTYEPFKSNILTVNVEVELRGIGNMKDELDLITGELTERIGEVVLNGSESWRIKDDQIYIKGTDFPIQPPEHLPNGKLITDSNIQINVGKNYIFVILQDDLPENIKQDNNENTLSNWKAYLQQNPMTVQYQLATESIKTVDLTKLPKLPKPYEGTNNYHLTANIPCEVILEVPVVSTGEQTISEINNY